VLKLVGFGFKRKLLEVLLNTFVHNKIGGESSVKMLVNLANGQQCAGAIRTLKDGNGTIFVPNLSLHALKASNTSVVALNCP
jgi:hypothetical protein